MPSDSDVLYYIEEFGNKIALVKDIKSDCSASLDRLGLKNIKSNLLDTRMDSRILEAARVASQGNGERNNLLFIQQLKSDARAILDDIEWLYDYCINEIGKENKENKENWADYKLNIQEKASRIPSCPQSSDIKSIISRFKSEIGHIENRNALPLDTDVIKNFQWFNIHTKEGYLLNHDRAFQLTIEIQKILKEAKTAKIIYDDGKKRHLISIISSVFGASLIGLLIYIFNQFWPIISSDWLL